MLSRWLTRNEQFVFVAIASAICVGAITLLSLHQKPPNPNDVPTASTHPSAPPMLANNRTPLNLQHGERTSSPSISLATQTEYAKTVRTVIPSRIRVAVMGWVRKPGTYEFQPEERVEDALIRAGGVVEGADLSDINLAAVLVDGTTLTVPRGRVAQISEDKLIIRGTDPEKVINPAVYTLSGRGTVTGKALSSGETRLSTNATNDLLDLNTASLKELESLPGIGPVMAKRIVEARPFTTVDDLARVKGIGTKRLDALRPLITVR